MRKLSIGEKVKLSDFTQDQDLEIAINITSALTIDITCFGLDQSKQLSDDRYMIFYNQTSAPEKSIQLIETSNGVSRFQVSLSKIPNSIRNLVFTATVDGNDIMSQIASGYVSVISRGVELLRYDFTGSTFKNEKAIILSEIYFKDLWRVGIVGRGFDGGLSALLKHFGGEEISTQDSTQNQVKADHPASKQVSTKKIALEKKMEEKAPAILSLAKKATISLQKVGLENHCAKVALCLDISGSMSSLYSSGKMQEFVEKILALGCRFDDDGSIDIFLFGQKAHEAGELSIDNFKGFIQKMLKNYSLEGGTYYGKVINMIRNFYKDQKSNLPTYVMFVTDGATSDEDYTKKQLIEASHEPIFWQFMAIGKSKKDVKASGKGFLSRLVATDFSFLEELDNMSGRYVDNANFFSVEDPALIADNQLYDLLMTEYPNWLKEARAKSLLR